MKQLPLIIDTSRFTFTVTKATEEKKDQTGKPRVNQQTGEHLYVLELLALDEKDGGVTFPVTVAGEPPNVTRGEPVTVVDLEAVPWTQGNRNGIMYRAKSVKPLAANKPKVSAAPAA